jgi:hypothetical protein
MFVYHISNEYSYNKDRSSMSYTEMTRRISFIDMIYYSKFYNTYNIRGGIYKNIYHEKNSSTIKKNNYNKKAYSYIRIVDHLNRFSTIK